MSNKRTYRTETVQRVDVAALLPLLMAGCIVAIDVAKQKFVVALATLAGDVVKLFRFDHPTETPAFLRLVEVVRAGIAPANMIAAMEPTGTYGDVVRHQLVERGLTVQMISPKRTHDSQELFDGVPSLHDPKSAVLVAKLCSMQLGTAWERPPTVVVRLRALVDRRRHEQERAEMCFGRLEALLARHWPEFGLRMDVREQKSALALLTKTTTAARVAVAPDAMRALVRQVSRGRIAMDTIDGLVADAVATLGVPAVEEEEQLIRALAAQASEARATIESLDNEMKRLVCDDEAFGRLAPWCGTFTAAVVLTMCDPRRYATARQFEKACGLNLREKSSGNHRGRVSITKRGPGLVRHVLYMFALRMIEGSAVLRAWYMRRRGYTEESKRRAVVALVRKLARAVFHVAHGAAFDAKKLVDTRRLEIDSTAAARSKRTRRGDERRSSAAPLRAAP